LQRAFPLDVSMVPSFALAFSTSSECLTCGDFSLGETVHLGSFEFISDYIGGLILFPRRSDSGTAFMGSTHSRPPSPRWAMTEDSTEELLTTSSRRGGSGCPSPRRLGTGAPLAPITTLPWQKDAPATQSMMTVQPWALAPRPHTGHSCKQRCTP
jgi:hypothetical protein